MYSPTEVMKIRIGILPKSRLGRWSVGLAGAFVLVFLSVVVSNKLGIVNLGQAGSILGMTSGISGVIALVTGLFSVSKRGERSILVFLALLVGLYALLLVIFLVWLVFFGGALFHLNF